MAAPVAVVGGGIAGGLLALALAEQGVAVTLVEAGQAGAATSTVTATSTATAWSYGVMAPWAAPATPLGGLQRRAPEAWRRLQRHHGDLGWRPTWFRPLGPGAPLAGRLPLPCSRVHVQRFCARLPGVLAAAGVERLQARVTALQPPVAVGRPWQLPWTTAQGSGLLQASQVVLAAGAGCRQLWPALPSRLRVSWAGLLALSRVPRPWPGGGPVPLRLPARFQRLAVEAAAASLREDTWLVDPGLLPWELESGGPGDGASQGWLAGQISLLRPGLQPGPPPDPALQEQRLRGALAPLLPALAGCPGQFHQVPVSFCTDGRPLVGPVPAAPGLWVFAGFSGAFALVPPLAPLLAQWLAATLAAGPAVEPGLLMAAAPLRSLAVLPET